MPRYDKTDESRLWNTWKDYESREKNTKVEKVLDNWIRKGYIWSRCRRKVAEIFESFDMCEQDFEVSWDWTFISLNTYGEFDPGSERTLAECLIHASRAWLSSNGYESGERVSNT